MQLAGAATTDSDPKSEPHRLGRRRAQRLHAVITMIAAITAAALLVGACSSSKKSTSSSSTTTASSPATTSAGSGSAADTAAITNAYVKLFAPDTPLDTSVGLLQDGAAFRSTLQSEGTTSYAKEASVKVSKVTVTSAQRATVIFSVLLNNSPVLPNQTGYAVKENGTWKVAGVTFCGLLTAQGNPPAACKQPAATTLPN